LDGGDADAAIREFDGLDLEGRRLRVEKAKGNAFTIITNFINLRSQFFRAIFISDGIVLVPRKFRIG
jgi:RNA recognition motif-containing protein